MNIKPRWWRAERDCDGSFYATCGLCFHRCRIASGAVGFCRVRGFGGDGFESPYLGAFTSCAVDPVEKKPLSMWHPGTFILSLGGVGCNMVCPFCQNHAIAQPTGTPRLMRITPEELLSRTLELGLSSVAYTYNEPALSAEYILKAAPMLKSEGIDTVLVSNGMFSDELTDEFASSVSAANIDIKTFDREIYRKLGGSLDTVLANITKLVNSGVHVEVTNLVVPGVSDSRSGFAEMVNWIAALSMDIPLHISRYFPAHTFKAPPTDLNMLVDFSTLARAKLRHVYTGNI